MELNDFDLPAMAAAGSTLTLRHPITGEALDGEITVQGQDAKSYRDILRAQLDRQMSGGDGALSAARLEADHVARLAALTEGWRGLQWQGADYPFSPENAIRLYTEQVWIREQVQAFTESRDNFFLTSARRF